MILGGSTYGGKPGTIDYDLPYRAVTIDGNHRPFHMVPVPLPKGYRQSGGRALNDASTILAVASNGPFAGKSQTYLVADGSFPCRSAR